MTTSDVELKELPLTRALTLAEVPGDGKHVAIKATDEELGLLADFADLEAVIGFGAELVIRPWGKTGYQISGVVRATVIQTCVVSLDPVENSVAEKVDLKLLPEREAERFAAAIAAAEAGIIDPDAEDLPDFFDGPIIDVGAIAVEFFALGIDPYPRKPGVVFEPLPDPDAEKVSHFAKLAQLKKDG
jgi:Large ribosomal RNA subunit accumulation protein YceD